MSLEVYVEVVDQHDVRMGVSLAQVNHDAVVTDEVEFLLGELKLLSLEEGGAYAVEIILWGLIVGGEVMFSSRIN